VSEAKKIAYIYIYIVGVSIFFDNEFFLYIIVIVLLGCTSIMLLATEIKGIYYKHIKGGTIKRRISRIFELNTCETYIMKILGNRFTNKNRSIYKSIANRIILFAKMGPSL
jgi:hypothetical protein